MSRARDGDRNGPARRQLLLAGTAGVGAIGVGTAAIGLDRSLLRTAAGQEDASAAAGVLLHGSETVPFHGQHQAGVETAAQASATFLGLDLREHVDREGLIRMLRLLTDDAARLTQGLPALADTEPEMATEPARLTVTFGFGPDCWNGPGPRCRSGWLHCRPSRSTSSNPSWVRGICCCRWRPMIR